MTEKISPFFSTGLVNRINAIKWVKREQQQASIHHVTGDVHFLVVGLPRKRTILTIHDLSFLKKGSLLHRFFLWLFWVYIPVHWAKFITCVSEETKKDILKYSFCNTSKVKVIYNFLREEFVFMPKEFNKACPVILQMGTNYNKNLHRLIEALTGINCHLRIIGMLSESVKIHLSNNHISYSNEFGLGDNDLLNEYRNADVVTFCSTLEGFGLPVIEGQAIGRVVVTSNTSSMPEIAGVGACFVDPFSVISIRNGIQKVIDDDDFREKIIKDGLKNIERFTIDRITKEYIKLYEDTCN